MVDRFGHGEVSIGSGYNPETQEPFVTLDVPQLNMGMSPENALELSKRLATSAELAYLAAFLIENTEGEIAKSILYGFKEWRREFGE